MFAARQIFLGRSAKAAWTNPYVTDGLVAMWDGEWNAGGGVHDASATTWKDLAGNCDISATDLKFSELSVNRGYADVTSSLTNFPQFSGDRTFRVVFRRVGGSLGQACCGFRDGSYWYFDGVAMGLVLRDATGNGYLTSSFTDTQITSCCVVVSGGSRTFYVNNQQRNTTTNTGPANVSPAVLWRYADFFDIAVYNRALSADEVAANYAIDKERFKLP